MQRDRGQSGLRRGRAAPRRGKTNFFEKRVGDYQKAGVMAGLGADARGHEISFDEDF